mgnify:FL=1
MPEIKHNFTGGRMNKDTDERLVPQGEYRNAMNISVSATSDGSDIGAAQNLLGNEELSCNNTYEIPTNARVVGSVSDEKNDSFYWLVSGYYMGPHKGNLPAWITDDDIARGLISSISDDRYLEVLESINSNSGTQKWHGYKDMIIGREGTACEPVFVDLYAFLTVTDEATDIVTAAGGTIQLDGINETIVKAVRPGWNVRLVQKSLNASGYNEIIASDPVNIIEVINTQDVMFTVNPGDPDNLGYNGYSISFDNSQYSWALSQVGDMANATTWGQVTLINSCPAFPFGGYVATKSSMFGITTMTIADMSAATIAPVAGEFSINFGGLSSSVGNTAGTIVLEGGIFQPSNPDFLTPPEPQMLLFYADDDRVLNFDHNRAITGINIIDDMLFWTDNYSEPKKINIPRSRSGTSVHAKHHTKLVNDYQDHTNELAREEHVTVLRQSPNQTISMELNNGRDQDVTYSAIINVTDGAVASPSSSSFLNNVYQQSAVHDFSGYSPGDIFYMGIDSDMDGGSDFDLIWKAGDLIGFEPFTDLSTTPPPIPMSGTSGWRPTLICEVMVWDDWNLHCDLSPCFSNTTVPYTITPGYQFPYKNSRIKFKVIEVNGVPVGGDINNGGITKYALDLFDEKDRLFEFKFPRFSFRYKYQDGEYSTFAPWSEVGFLPGNYGFHPKKGFNTGMVNTVQKVVLSGFVGGNMPKDVEYLDILYKDDSSPNVYVVDTISSKDEDTITVDGVVTNHWKANQYTLENSAVQKLLPSNQLLRPWDNVPRTAAAQEVSGSRIIYGNYLQNYNLEARNVNSSQNLLDTVYSPRFVPSLTNSDISSKKSIKSLREYQLGVVFSDKYGRETPVLTNKSGTIKIDKLYSQTPNKFEVSLTGGIIPNDMVYFKFYIKETAGEYYNLALDRYYDADDGNIWLSFASSDRNKVDIDTFLILKKGQDSDNLIIDKARYKVLAIENEAPDYIKTSTVKISSQENEGTGGDPDLFDTNFSNCPRQAASTFKVSWARFRNTAAGDMDEIMNEKLFVEFSVKGSSTTSKRYKIIEISNDGVPDPLTGASTPIWFNITVEKPFGEDVNFISNDPDGLSSNEILAGGICNILKSDIENKPEFDGRFFVKIFADTVFDNAVKVSSTDTSDYRVTASRLLYRGYGERNGPLYHMNLDADGPIIMDALTYYGTQGWQQTVKRFETFYGTNAWQAEKTQTSGETRWSLDGFSNALTAGSSKPKGMWYIDSMDGDTLNGGSIGSVPNNDLPATDPIEANSQVSINQPGGKGFYSKNGYANSYDTFDISFGPIEPKMEFVSSGSTADDDYSLTGQDGHFAIGINNYIEESDFASKLYPGYQFRWEGDPEQRIYTVEEVKMTQQLNHTGPWENGGMSNQIDLAQDYYWDMNLPKFSDPWYSWRSNYSKRYSVTFTPGMNFTNHFSPGGTGTNINALVATQGISQVIPAGLHIDIEAIAYGANTIVGKSNLTTGDLAIFVSTLYGTDSTTGETRKIKVGMVVESYDNGTAWPQVDVHNSTGSTNRPVIRKIEEVAANKYKLFLSGSLWPITKLDVAVTPTAGESYVFGQLSFNGYSPYSALSAIARVSPVGTITAPVADDMQFDHSASSQENANNLIASGHILEFIEPYEFETSMPDDPAVFETEADDESQLNIYYEASAKNAFYLNSKTIANELALGSKVIFQNDNGGTTDLSILNYPIAYGNSIILNESICADTANGICTDANGIVTNEVVFGSILKVIKPSGGTIYVRVQNVYDTSIDANGNEVSSTFEIQPFLYNARHGLDWHNCYSFGNGVESNRIRDNFNLPFISNGVIASTTLEGDYKEEHRKHGLIYSGLYNSMSGINNLNQFIAAEKITKDINPIYGSIQKLHSRNSDLVALCEDKILKILANKDAVFNADGNPNLVATTNVLGQTIPFAGDYGIGKDPESFASSNYRVYFADKIRGSVLRLSKDGVTPISDSGMRDWFRDNLELAENIIGSYDPREQEYNLTLRAEEFSYSVGFDSVNSVPLAILTKAAGEYDTTLSFREDVRGWVSFKSFVSWNGVGSSNNYYTFNNGRIWIHHSEGVDRNSFYGVRRNSSLKVILNDLTSVVKSFTAINYEGDQAKVDGTGTAGPDGQYYNINENFGWWVENIKTDLDKGRINEFIKKEGKWFNYIKGTPISLSTTPTHKISTNYDGKNFAHQGLGSLVSYDTTVGVLGCLNPDAVNYAGPGNTLGAGNTELTPVATIDDGSCAAGIPGCTDPTALNYFSFANISDGSCTYEGCMDSTTVNGSGFGVGGFSGNGQGAMNYNPAASVDDGSCEYCVFGCIDNTMFNYDANATCDDGSCIPVVLGCTDNGALNTNLVNMVPAANTDDGSCDYYGCNNPLALNFMHPIQTNGISGANANGQNLSCWDTQVDFPVSFVYNTYPFPGPSMDYLEDINAYQTANGYPNITFIPACPTIDDGSCDVAGCVDTLACNYDADATDQIYVNPLTGNWSIVQSPGLYSNCLFCDDPDAFNYDPDADCNNGCQYCQGIDPATVNFTPDAINDPATDLFISFTLPAIPLASATYPTISQPVNSGIYKIEACLGVAASTPPYTFNIFGDIGCFDIDHNTLSGDIVQPGVDISAYPNITVFPHQISTVYEALPATDYKLRLSVVCVNRHENDPFDSNGTQIPNSYNSIVPSTHQATTTTAAYPSGCTDPSYAEYDAAAITNDGSCYNYLACTDASAVNWIGSLYDVANPSTWWITNYLNNNGGAFVDDGSCTYVGCMDNTYCGYSANASVSCADNDADGIPDCCLDACGDPNAMNYTPGLPSGCIGNCSAPENPWTIGGGMQANFQILYGNSFTPSPDSTSFDAGTNLVDHKIIIQIPSVFPTPNMTQQGYDGIGSNNTSGTTPWPIINPNIYWHIEAQYREVGTSTMSWQPYINGIGPCGGPYSYCPGDIYYNFDFANPSTIYNSFNLEGNKQYQIRFASRHAQNPQLDASDYIKKWSDWAYFDTTVI